MSQWSNANYRGGQGDWKQQLQATQEALKGNYPPEQIYGGPRFPATRQAPQAGYGSGVAQGAQGGFVHSSPVPVHQSSSPNDSRDYPGVHPSYSQGPYGPNSSRVASQGTSGWQPTPGQSSMQAPSGYTGQTGGSSQTGGYSVDPRYSNPAYSSSVGSGVPDQSGRRGPGQ